MVSFSASDVAAFAERIQVVRKKNFMALRKGIIKQIFGCSNDISPYSGAPS
jgi:hypothetical protein